MLTCCPNLDCFKLCWARQEQAEKSISWACRPLSLWRALEDLFCTTPNFLFNNSESYKKTKQKPVVAVAAHTSNPSTWKTEAGDLTWRLASSTEWVPRHSRRLHRETLTQKKQNKTKPLKSTKTLNQKAYSGYQVTHALIVGFKYPFWCWEYNSESHQLTRRAKFRV